LLRQDTMTEPDRAPDSKDFLDAASTKNERGIIGEFIAFMAENKAWWMVPILVVLGLFFVVLVLIKTGAAPFLYSFF